ncbi:MAG: phosphatidylserine decarboxylase [Candidatus Paceibacteria bacterium]|jgi:phosphatidylserine decarboxylase
MRRIYKKILPVFFTAIMILAVFVSYFNRAPSRSIPNGNVVISPATGDVIHIEKAETNQISFLKKGLENTLVVQGMEPPYNIVVIEMDPTDVHVQRAPIDGEVIYQEHVPGQHKNAIWSKNVTELANENEKNLIVIENEDLSVGVIQVAGIMARRIVSYVSPTDILEKGELYGRIKLGSQVVIILPEIVELDVTLGDTLVDGESIIARY